MIKTTRLLALLLLASSIFFTACDKEDEHMDEHNHVSIDIVSPDAGTVADPASVLIDVVISAEEENHEIEIKLFPTDDPGDLIIDKDLHDHDAEVSFTQTVDLSSYDAGTEFTLEIEACEDHDCEEIASEVVEFSI
ncbi:MAG: hypothetical protein GYB31_18795 [Bacteroidetes bacterium]|nr:hypothetical protein [Bacteroidota bacterium]